MIVNRLSPWFGSNTENAALYARQLGKLRWCAVPFAGGMSELAHIDTAAGVACDLHRHVINLARAVRDDNHKAALIARLKDSLFHPDELKAAQNRCVDREYALESGLFSPAAAMNEGPDTFWAADYFMACWMGRGGTSGKTTEFTQSLAIRYTSSGGDSAKRFQSAIASLEEWHAVLHRWSFDCVPAFDVLSRVRDQDGHGVYVDPPWPGVGDEYRHRFNAHARLRDMLSKFTRTRVVVRYGVHPLITDLYDRPPWTIREVTSRNQQNNDISELMIVNGPLLTEDSQ